MTIEVTKKDIQEVEKRLPELTEWMSNHFVSPTAILFCLNSIMDGIATFEAEATEK